MLRLWSIIYILGLGVFSCIVYCHHSVSDTGKYYNYCSYPLIVKLKRKRRVCMWVYHTHLVTKVLLYYIHFAHKTKTNPTFVCNVKRTTVADLMFYLIWAWLSIAVNESISRLLEFNRFTELSVCMGFCSHSTRRSRYVLTRKCLEFIFICIVICLPVVCLCVWVYVLLNLFIRILKCHEKQFALRANENIK